MLVLTTTTNQTVNVGDAIIFDQVILATGKCNCASRNIHRLARIGNGVHDVAFHGNVSSTTASTVVELGIAFDGVIAPEARGAATIVGANNVYNVAMETATKVCCCKCSCDTMTVTVRNTGTSPIVVLAGATLKVARLG